MGYIGPYAVFSRAEVERLHELMVNHFLHKDPPVEAIDEDIQAKLDAALKSHEDFLRPAT